MLTHALPIPPRYQQSTCVLCTVPPPAVGRTYIFLWYFLTAVRTDGISGEDSTKSPKKVSSETETPKTVEKE